jgi:hypothetical protein
MATAITSWKHDELALDLAAHLRGASDRLVWTDMQLGPAGSPRPDVYTVPCSYSRFMPVAYEVKISVADFRRDITAGKWSSYLKFAAGVIFCVPAGLIKKEDVPSGCGLMIRSENVWRTVKGPTLKAVDNLPRDAWMKLVIDGVARIRNDADQRMRAQMTNEWRVEQRIRQRLGDVVADAVQAHTGASRSLEYSTDRLKKAAVEADAEYQKIIGGARERAKRESAVVDSARLELARVLGLPEDADPYTIANRAHELARRLDGDSELERLRQQVKQIRRALDEAEKPLPSIARVAA